MPGDKENSSENSAADVLSSCRESDTGRRAPKTVEAVRQDVAKHIEIMLRNPAMWVGDEAGKSAFGIDTALASLCLLWAIIENRSRDYHKAHRKMLEAAGCVDYSTELSGLVRTSLEDVYRLANPNATEKKIVAYVVENWRSVANDLEIPIDSCAP